MSASTCLATRLRTRVGPLCRSLALILALIAGGCGGATTDSTVFGPSSERCSVTASLDPSSIPAGGGTTTLLVAAARECQWSARAEAGWVTLSPTSGTGDATVGVTVASNAQFSTRRARVVVNDTDVELIQAAAPIPPPAPPETTPTPAPPVPPPGTPVPPPASCTPEIDPAEQRFDEAGGTGRVRVEATAGCSWRASSDASWIVIASAGEGSGSGEVQYRVERNRGSQARTGTITVGERTHRVQQTGVPAPTPTCSYQLDVDERSFGPDGGGGSVRVQTGPGCDWSASPSASWIVLASDREGSGNAEVQYRVERNTSTQPRSGTITIAGRTHRVQQGGAPPAAPTCSYDLEPEERSFSAEGGTAGVRVRAAAGCEWTASSTASWILISPGGGGSGTGDVQYRVERNSSTQPRTGTVVVAGRMHRVQQSGAPEPAPTCSYELDPQERSFAADGGTAGVRVRAPGGCEWSASSSASWIVISSNGTGTGTGDVQYRVERNSSTQARTGTVTIAGRIHRVEQSGAPEPTPTCSYDLDPQDRSFRADGGTGSVRVRTTGGCTWNASSTASWIVISANGAGSGNGEVQYRVERNSSTQARIGTITIAGRTHRVEQSGAPEPEPTCSYQVNPQQRSFGPNGGTAEIRVRTQSGCRWSASANVNWITITSTREGAGDGAIQYRVDANSGSAARTGSVSVGGHTVEVTQNAR